MSKIDVMLCDSASDMGDGGTEEDVSSWVAYVTEALEKTYPNHDISVGTKREEGTVVRVDSGIPVSRETASDLRASDELKSDVKNRIQSAWGEWCEGARATV